MRYLTVILVLLLAGCVKATYTSTGTTETFEVVSVFKSIEGLSAMRTPEIFAIRVDKTNSTNVIADIAQILQFYVDPLQ